MSENPKFYRLPAVVACTGLSRSAIYAMARNGTFPKPLKIGPRASAWSSLELGQWIASRLAARAETSK